MKELGLGIVCGVVLGLCLAAGTARAAGEGRATLDGKTFVGESGEKGKTTGSRETIHFVSGRFRSVACDPYGFGDAPYEAATSAGGTVNWSAETTSPKEGTIQWKGTVSGDALNGTFVWTKAGQAPIEYWLKATAQK